MAMVSCYHGNQAINLFSTTHFKYCLEENKYNYIRIEILLTWTNFTIVGEKYLLNLGTTK